MDEREIKEKLRDAKKALQGNNYQEASTLCKAVLKKQPGNYQANLLLGTALREQGKYQQALEMYKRSIEIEPGQIYGWQGVILVYEKQNIRNHTDLLDAYKRLATHFEKDDKSKYIENTLKLANILISQQDGTKALKVVGRLAKSVGLNLEIAQILVQLFNATTSETRTPDEDDLYTRALENFIEESPQPAEETYKKFFSQLYRSNQYGKLALHCTGMQHLWNHYHSPMEWVCRLYLENRIEQSQLLGCGGVEKITDRLFKLHPSSRYGYFARGKFLVEEACKYVEGFTWIKNALESAFNMHAALVLVRGKLKFGDYEGAMEDTEKALANCKDDNLAEKEAFEVLFKLLNLEGLIGTNEIEHAEQERINLEDTFKQSPDHLHRLSFLDLSIRISLKVKKLSELSNLIEQIDSATTIDGVPLWRLDLYRAILEAFKNGDEFSTYINSCIQTHGDLPDLVLESAIFLFDHGDYKNAAEVLTSLASTVEGKSHPHTWKYLGLLAHLEGDLEKSARYFKKSYDLNLDSDVGALLCDIYQELGDLPSKKELLIDAINKVRKTKSKWVWSRLGLMYLEEGDLLAAVESFQSAIRVDLEDGFLWESLADAYFFRGSLHAALRCYNKALEKGVDTVYPLMRISTIYQFLEEEDKSIKSLKELIEANPNNTSLHFEMAKLYLWVANEKVKENFDRGAISAVENGLECAVKAILYAEKQMLLPWMVIGEYTITLADLPEETELKIPTLLVNYSTSATASEMLQEQKINLKTFKEIGTKSLLQGLKIMNSTDVALKDEELLSYINHQLALSYYKRSCTTVDDEGRKGLLMSGLHHCKKAIAISYNNSLYWNTIGLIAFRLSDMPFSLHCFTRALQLDINNMVAWGNLGMLYYQNGEYMLAHKAFAKGQSVAPVYANSWIGQGLVAEELAPQEAPDLFRHACLLKPHPYAIASYGNSICDFLLDPKGDSSEDRQYWYWHLLTRMDGVTHLYDLISRIENRAATPQLYNLKGFIAGWSGFYQTAFDSFDAAVQLLQKSSKFSDEENFLINGNKVSALVAHKLFSEAKTELTQFPKLDTTGLANAALTLYKMGDTNTAIGMYQRILALPGEDVKTKTDVKIGLALLANQTLGTDQAKSILFAKDMTKNPRALLTLGAIAVSQTDLQLLKAVLHELKPSQWTSQLAPDIAFLQVCFHILQKSFKAAVKVILRFIHMYPTNPRLYALACQVIITYNLDNYHVSVPRHMAHCTLKMARIVGTSREEGLFASKHSGVVSLTYLVECNIRVAVMATLKAIRCYPEQRDNWAVLACAYWMDYSRSKNPRLFLNVINILDREINLGLCTSRIKEWMMAFRVEIAKYT